MLQTEKTLLRMPLKEDKQFLSKMRNDIELQGMLISRAKPNTENRIDEWLSKKTSDRHGFFFIVADMISNHPIGYIELTNIDFVDRRGDLGICIDKHQHGKGYAKDAVFLLENYAKNLFNIRKIILQVLNSNSRAISFYKKVGYRNIGVFDDHFYMDDQFHDVLLMEKKL